MNSAIYVERGTKQSISGKFQNNAIQDAKQISSNGVISNEIPSFSQRLCIKYEFLL